MMRKKHSDLELGVYLIFGGAWLIISGLRRFRRKRDVEDTSTAKIRSAPQGSVEVQGYAWPFESQEKNNLDGKECVFRNLVVLKKVNAGKRSSWIKVYEDHHELPFLVFDQTGTVLVKPEGADYEVRKVKYRWKDIHPKMQDVLKMKISTSGFPPSGGMFGPIFEFHEKYILAGSPVYLRGNFSTPANRPRVNPAGGFVDFVTKVRSLTPESNFFKLLDGNGSGEISEEEARFGFSTAAAISLRQRTKLGTIGCAGIITSSLTTRLYIADCHQQYLLKRLKNWNFLRIVFGAILVGAGVVMILSDLKQHG